MALRVRLLQRGQGALDVAQPGVDQGEVVGRDVLPPRALLDLGEQRARLGAPALQRQGVGQRAHVAGLAP